MNYLKNVQNKVDLEEALRQDEKEKVINYKKFDADRIQILLMSDEHMGNAQYNRDLHLKVLENAYNKGWYILHLGDGMETATKGSVGAGVYTQEEIVDKQMANFIATYKPFADNGTFIGAHPGNHEWRVFKDDGLNVMKHACREIKAKYLGIAKAHIFRVGNINYTMYTTHGASGARMPYTKIKAAIDMEKIIDTDIYAQGHLHQLSHHVRNYNYINMKNKQIETKQKNYILTGSYLDYFGSYAQMLNLEPARLGSPIVMLNGFEKQIKVSLQ